MKRKGTVPDRWNSYTPMGRQVPGTRFISFKTPLNSECRGFTPRTVIDHCSNLGLVIDLTNTTRYYDPEDFRSQGVEYQKVSLVGRMIPKDEDFNKFYVAACQFLRKNKENNKLIGVHCTHGLNRTGYLICRYMIKVLGIPADQAIADFNSSRGHVQERDPYLEDLRLAPWLFRELPNPKKFYRWNNSNRRSTPSTPATSSSRSAVETPETPATPSSHSASANRGKDESDPETPSSSVPLRKWNDSNPSPRSYDVNSPHGRGQQSEYYDQQYYGRVAPQYNPYFYQEHASGMGAQRRSHNGRYNQEQSSGIGPHRSAPYWTRKNQQEQNSRNPRTYRGPRPPRTPRTPRFPENPRTPRTPNQHEESYSSPSVQRGGAYGNTPSSSYNRRQSHDNVFSPATPGRRSNRWRPY